MDALGLSPLLDLLKLLGLPQIPAAIGKKDGNYIEKIAKVRRLLGKDVMIGLDIIPDPKNRSRNIIVIDVPSALSPLPG